MRVSDLIQTLSTARRRFTRNERDVLRELVLDPANMHRFSLYVSKLLTSEKKEDGHSLEEMFIVGAEVHDIVRGPLIVPISRVTRPVAAFVFGFRQQPLSKVFEEGAVKAVLDSLVPATPAESRSSAKVKGRSKRLRIKRASLKPGGTPQQVIVTEEVMAAAA